MTYYVRIMGYNRWPQPVFKLLGPDTIQQEPPQFERGWVYRLNLLDLPTDPSTWPEFVVVRITNQPITDSLNDSVMLVEVFVVLLAEWKDYVEPLQTSALN